MLSSIIKEKNKNNNSFLKDKKKISKEKKTKVSKKNNKLSIFDVYNQYLDYMKKFYWLILILFAFVSSYQSLTKTVKRFTSLYYKRSTTKLKIIAFINSLLFLNFYFTLTSSNLLIFKLLREYHLVNLLVFCIVSLPLNLLDGRIFRGEFNLKNDTLNTIENIFCKIPLIGEYLFSVLRDDIYYLYFTIWYCILTICGIYSFICGWNLVKEFNKKLSLLEDFNKNNYFQKKNKDLKYEKETYINKFKNIIHNVLVLCAIIPLLIAIINFFNVFYYFKIISLEGSSEVGKIANSAIKFQDIIRLNDLFSLLINLLKNRIIFLKNFIAFGLLFLFVIISYLTYHLSFYFDRLNEYKIIVEKKNNSLKTQKQNIIKSTNLFNAISNLIYKSSKLVKTLYLIVFFYFFLSVFNSTYYDKVVSNYVHNSNLKLLNLFFKDYYYIIEKYDAAIIKPIYEIYHFILFILIEFLSVLIIQFLCFLIKYCKFISLESKHIKKTISYALSFSMFSIMFLCGSNILLKFWNYKISFFVILFDIISNSLFRSFKYMIIDELLEKVFLLMDDNLVIKFQPLIKSNAQRTGQFLALLMLLCLNLTSNSLIFGIIFLIIDLIIYLSYYYVLTYSFDDYNKKNKTNKKISY
jgi:hypothetical protein